MHAYRSSSLRKPTHPLRQKTANSTQGLQTHSVCPRAWNHFSQTHCAPGRKDPMNEKVAALLKISLLGMTFTSQTSTYYSNMYES
jgi:hypothetical protein